MMGKVFGIGSGKGGVGKTTSVANISVLLAKAGKKVLVIDADLAMANMSIIFGLETAPITLHEVLLGEARVKDAIYDAPGGVHFMPAGLSLQTYKRLDSERLKEIVSSVKDDYDYVIIDTPPGVDRDTASAYAASEELIIVLTPDPPAVADALKAKILAERVKAKPIGFILNMVRGEAGELSREDISKALELPCYGVVPYDSFIRKCLFRKKIQPSVLIDENTPSSKAFKRIASRILGVELKEEEEGLLSRILKFFRRR